jgi:DNA repair protein RadA/Sms
MVNSFPQIAGRMAKSKTVFFCQKCGYESPKWLGKCPSCNEWNTFVEEIVQKESAQGWSPAKLLSPGQKLKKIDEIGGENVSRMDTRDPELSRVLGGGIVPASFVLIGGEPGIGKSTLMLQEALAFPGRKVLYVSGEESHQQIKMRADRLGIANHECYILSETELTQILGYAMELQPDLLIIDSIQTLYTSKLEGSPGSVSQVRECAGSLLRFAKEAMICTFIIGHITKDGTIAGPKLLEHMVDTVLMFEGERHLNYRILRTIKNRFGSASELGIYEMHGEGLKPVLNPSDILLSHRDDELSGVAISSMLEGNRPLMIEIQSLVTLTGYSTPQRSGTGFDARRLSMLLAVLEKRGGFRLGNQDVFLNIAGGLKVEDPAIDLAVCISLISSLENRVIPASVCFSGEVGLGGEVRAVNRIENRIAEAERLGFKTMFISSYNFNKIKPDKYKLEIIGVKKLDDLIVKLFLKKKS